MKKIWKSTKSRLADESGNVAMIFALTLVPVAVLSGGAVDYGRALNQRTALQAASEAAAFAAAMPAEMTEAERIEMATKVFIGNITGTANAGIVPNVTVSGQTVSINAATSVNTPFLGLVNISSVDIHASTAVEGGATIGSTVTGGKLCLLALDPNSDDGIHLQGDNHVKYTDCWAHTNSTKPTAINANGSNATAVGAGHCAVGSYTQTHTTFTPVPTANCSEVADPFANVGAYSAQAYSPKFVPPAPSTSCKANNLSLKKGTFTLDPGRYCGGINIQAGATVNFNPGVYYIENGVFNVQSGSSVTGSNVLFYLAGATTRMQVIGGGTVNLSGRTSGSSYQGFLVIQHPDAYRGGESNFQGGGTFKLQGVVYMPTQRIEVAGNGDVNAADINVFGMVAKDFYFRGNGVFNTKKHNGAGAVPDIMPNMPTSRALRKTVLK